MAGLARIGLRCPTCQAPLVPGAGNVFSCRNDHRFAYSHGVLDLYRYEDRAPHDSGTRRPADDAILSAIGTRLAFLPAQLKAVGLLDTVEPTGNPFFDAEEELFVERFNFVNEQPVIELSAVYATGNMQPGANWIAVRVKNASAFPISSLGEKPVLLSYHVRSRDGAELVFEGARSSLPVDLQPGRSVTAHLRVDLPAEPTEQHLDILPIQEFVAWMDQSAVRLPVSTLPLETTARRLEAERPFSEALDDELASDFLSRHLQDGRDDLVGLEIGGGIVATLSKWMNANGRSGTIINNDISTRILKLAVLLSERSEDNVTLHARFDANRIPVEDGALDLVLFSRSLHHFEDPVRVLAESRRVLKPNGLLFLVCEPVGHAYDDFTKNLIRQNVNEQVFPLDGYLAICERGGFSPVDLQVDWGFSLKGAFQPKP